MIINDQVRITNEFDFQFKDVHASPKKAELS